MNNSIWSKRIPTLLGIGVIILGIGATSFLVNKGAIFTSRANPSETPRDIRITNITDTSFTVSYKTESDVIGSISYGQDKNLTYVAIDDRDQQNTNVTARKLHYITLRGLASATKINFSITSGEGVYLNNDLPFETTTGQVIKADPTSQQPIVGKIISEDSSNINEAIVYATSQNAQAISTLVKPDGSYILPLNSIRTTDLSSYFSITQDTSVKLLILAPSQHSNVLLSAKQLNPVPLVTLSQNYDFTVNTSPLANPANSSSFPVFSANPSSSTIKIISPKKDEKFSDQQPLFRGTASPGANIEIIIHSSGELKDTVIADNKGNWTYRPKTALPPGEHTLSLTTNDPSGIIKTLTQSFVVFASGTQVSESATPSATPTKPPTTTPTQIPTPTVFFTPTPTSAFISTFTPIPTSVSKGFGGQDIPSPGNSSLLTVGIVSLTTTAVGLILFLLSRGNTSL